MLHLGTWSEKSQGCSSLVGEDSGAVNLSRLWQSHSQKLARGHWIQGPEAGREASPPAAVGDAAHEALHAVPALRRGAHQPPHAVHHAAARQGDAEVGHGDSHLLAHR